MRNSNQSAGSRRQTTRPDSDNRSAGTIVSRNGGICRIRSEAFDESVRFTISLPLVLLQAAGLSGGQASSPAGSHSLPGLKSAVSQPYG